MSPALRRTFDSLRVPNYRRYFAGQVVSVSGNWIQNVAAMWLMVQLTGDGLAVGLTAAAQFLPLMLFGVWGGLLADRVDKRRLLLATQVALMVPAVVLAVLTFTGAVTPLWIYAMVFLRGTAMAIDNPARQALPIELVGPGRVVNAVALNSVVIQASRIVGPGIAGVLIAVAGIGWCFVVDALSFLAMIWALLRLDPEAMGEAPRAPRHRGAIREGVAYVRGTPELLVPLAMMGLIGLLSFNFQILLPLLAQDTWEGTATTFTLLTTTMAVGSVAGALVAGNRGHVSPRLLVGAATLFGTFELLAAAAPVLPLQLLPLLLLGMASVTFSAGVSSTLQLQVEPAMRGRVMALYSLVFLGSTPIGAPLVGGIAAWAGPRAGMAVGGAGALAAAAGAAWAYRRLERRPCPPPGPSPATLAVAASGRGARLRPTRPSHARSATPSHCWPAPSGRPPRPGSSRAASGPPRPRPWRSCS